MKSQPIILAYGTAEPESRVPIQPLSVDASGVRAEKLSTGVMSELFQFLHHGSILQQCLLLLSKTKLNPQLAIHLDEIFKGIDVAKYPIFIAALPLLVILDTEWLLPIMGASLVACLLAGLIHGLYRQCRPNPVTISKWSSGYRYLGVSEQQLRHDTQRGNSLQARMLRSQAFYSLWGMGFSVPCLPAMLNTLRYFSKNLLQLAFFAIPITRRFWDKPWHMPSFAITQQALCQQSGRAWAYRVDVGAYVCAWCADQPAIYRGWLNDSAACINQYQATPYTMPEAITYLARFSNQTIAGDIEADWSQLQLGQNISMPTARAFGASFAQVANPGFRRLVIGASDTWQNWTAPVLGSAAAGLAQVPIDHLALQQAQIPSSVMMFFLQEGLQLIGTLQSLTIAGLSSDDMELLCMGLTQADMLHSLYISNTAAWLQILDHCAELPINTLVLNQAAPRSADWALIRWPVALQNLSLNAAMLSSSNLTRLAASLPIAQNASFYVSKSTSDLSALLPGFTHFNVSQALSLPGFPMSDAVVSQLLALPGFAALQTLNLAGVRLTDDAQQALLRRLPQTLQRLNLSGWVLLDETAKLLAARLPALNLQALQLSRCELSDGAYAAIMDAISLSSVYELDVSRLGLGDKMLAPLHSVTQQITQLTLSYNDFNSLRFIAFLDDLNRNHTWVDLNLDGVALTSGAMQSLCELVGQTGIRALSQRGVVLAAETLSACLAPLATSHALAWDISGSTIGDQGAAVISRFLSNSTCQLAQNVSSSCAQSLFTQQLPKYFALLNLQATGITEQGASALCWSMISSAMQPGDILIDAALSHEDSFLQSCFNQGPAQAVTLFNQTRIFYPATITTALATPPLQMLWLYISLAVLAVGALAMLCICTCRQKRGDSKAARDDAWPAALESFA